MLALRYIRQTRALLYPSLTLLFSTFAIPHRSLLTSFFPNPTVSHQSRTRIENVDFNFREWFLTRKKPLIDQIYTVLHTVDDDSSIDSSLAQLNICLTEELVLEVLTYHKNKDVLASLKFFDWAARQRGFNHTDKTFNAVFRTLKKAGMSDLILKFLQNYERKSVYMNNVSFQSILIVGYAISGQCDLALQVFGKLRILGGDLNDYAYHLFLDCLVEQGYFDVADVFVKEIRARGYESETTHSIVIKSLLRQKQFDKGEKYLREVVLSGDNEVSRNCGRVVGQMVSALFKDNQYDRAALLVEELRDKGVVAMDYAYSAWIRELLSMGKLEGALKFFKDKRELEGYVPDVFRYNMLVSNLLSQNRFDEVFDLLLEMKGIGILPDEATLNSVLCLLCKVGRMDIAMDLYDSREEFGLSLNYIAYDYLINTLLGDGSADLAYSVLVNSIEQGYFPPEMTFLVIADELCRDGKPDKMKELVCFAIKRNKLPSNTYDKLIWTLCTADRVDDGYWVYNLLGRLNMPTRNSTTYIKLIIGFTKSGRAENAIRLFTEMQRNEISGTSRVITDVICCICKMDNPDKIFYRFLEMQLATPGESASEIYNYFIDGAALARKPELARQVYKMMGPSGVEAKFRHELHLLKGYIYGDNIPQAVHLFQLMSQRWPDRKLYHYLIRCLCTVSKPDHAASVMSIMKSAGKLPGLVCYEELIKSYCVLEQFPKAIDVVNVMGQIPRSVSTFIGNTFMLYALKCPRLYLDWVDYTDNNKNLTGACRDLGHLIGVFSGFIQEAYGYEDMEKLIQKSFHMDVFTNNMLLRRAGIRGVDNACEVFHRMREKGYEPNSWTYNAIVHALAKEGRMTEANHLLAEMHAKGYSLLEFNKKYLA